MSSFNCADGTAGVSPARCGGPFCASKSRDVCIYVGDVVVVVARSATFLGGPETYCRRHAIAIDLVVAAAARRELRRVVTIGEFRNGAGSFLKDEEEPLLPEVRRRAGSQEASLGSIGGCQGREIGRAAACAVVELRDHEIDEAAVREPLAINEAHRR